MNSAEYYKLYQQKASEAEEWAKYQQMLSEILNSLRDVVQEGAGTVNRKLDDLHEAIEQGIRGNAEFACSGREAAEDREGDISADPELSEAVRELEEKIERTRAKKHETEEDRDYYYSRYWQEREKERWER